MRFLNSHIKDTFFSDDRRRKKLPVILKKQYGLALRFLSCDELALDVLR